jgi:hypothetical protein
VNDKSVYICAIRGFNFIFGSMSLPWSAQL